MNIKVKFTRAENQSQYNGKQEVEMDIEEYLKGVVPSEIGNAPIEAGKAQAIAARTFALSRVKGKGYITDSSSVDQAFRASRLFSNSYSLAHQAVEQTKGQVLYYGSKLCETCVYGASNGGRMVSSKERWGGERGYLVSKDDPWDAAISKGIKRGHGVGMSQLGATYAARQGVSCSEILAFYYPGTEIRNNYGEKTIEEVVDKLVKIPETITVEEVKPAVDYSVMPEVKKTSNGITAQALCAQCYIPLREKWGYIWANYGQVHTAKAQRAATREQTIKWGAQWIGRRTCDCSGLLYWAFKELGGYIYHGSNTIWNKYCTKQGKITKDTELRPGTAVFLLNKKNGKDNRHHIGLFVGNDTVIESAGTKTGVTTSKVSHWDEWGELKGVDYGDTVAEKNTQTPNNSTVTAPSNILCKGASGDAVKELQTMLLNKGFNPGVIDGKYGNNTANAVRAFQKANRLKVDGIAGPQTLAALKGE